MQCVGSVNYMVLDRGLWAEFEEKDPFFENTRLDPEIFDGAGWPFT